MNIQGQTKLPLAKQLQIEDFVKINKIDILHMQEVQICDETFSDKRRISLLNADFKTASGTISRRFKATTTRSLSPFQLVAGDDRRIHHGINLARDAIQASSILKSGCGIADTDYEAAFDYLVMSWMFLVLQKKGVSMEVISILKNLYQDNLSIVVVNNIAGRTIKNNRLSLRQGGHSIHVLLCIWY